MKEYRELWNGSTLALDIGLVGGDWELAGAVWRNCFDARGWDLGGTIGEDGKLVSSPGSSSDAPTSMPTPISPLGGQASGTSNRATSEQNPDKALTDIPIHVYTFVAYLRRELKRLEDIPDEMIIQEMNIGEWGRMQGTVYGDDIANTPITKAELERWTKTWEEIGSYS
jgi:cytochrome b pre-mRNA-processing protein 3